MWLSGPRAIIKDNISCRRYTIGTDNGPIATWNLSDVTELESTKTKIAK